MSDFFSSMIRLQEEAVKVQRLQLEAARKWSDAAADGIVMQKSMSDAAGAGWKAWNAALGFWGIKK